MYQFLSEINTYNAAHESSGKAELVVTSEAHDA